MLSYRGFPERFNMAVPESAREDDVDDEVAAWRNLSNKCTEVLFADLYRLQFRFQIGEVTE